MHKVSFAPILPSLQENVLKLLIANHLPTSDIGEKVQLFTLQDKEQLFGVVGLECYGTDALLRSLSVANEAKGKGYGKYLVQQIEEYAVQNDCQTLYLLTTTAQDFFARLNYQVIDRQSVPQNILATTEFSSICPSTAICMCKRLEVKI